MCPLCGSKSRPILRIRVDVPGSEPGAGVSVDDCARVSRAVEEYLDEASDVAERYVLEVSSPGVERPLVRAADFSRFAGQEIRSRSSHAICQAGVARTREYPVERAPCRAGVSRRIVPQMPQWKPLGYAATAGSGQLVCRYLARAV